MPSPQQTSAPQYWEIVKDMIDQLIDLMLNYRQSGHPGGSRSKVHLLVTLLLSGAFRWDIRDPGRRFADRFILSAGHTVPLVYATLAVLAEAMRLRESKTGEAVYAIDPARIIDWRDLPQFRHRHGLSGHAEMSGKTHFLKFNTGPSGHGLPVAAGEALALQRAGAGEVRVFALEGEGGLTPGGTHETINSAWGLGLENLHLLLDWNDFGIDPQPISRVVPGTPRDWFEPHGWRVAHVADGTDWRALSDAMLALTAEAAGTQRPALLYARTRKGRGYLKYDAPSHGAPHTPMNCELFWKTKRPFMERYGIEFEGYGEPAPEDPQARAAQMNANLERVMQVLRSREDLIVYLSDRLIALAGEVPEEITGFRLIPPSPCADHELFNPETYPEQLWAAPGEIRANKDALGRWGAYINDTCRERYGRPLFLACSADLAQSTSIVGFAGSWGWFDRSENPEGALLPQEITEFTNAGLMVGLAATNLASNPWEEFDGFYGACSTYGAFSYLKYGPMRLFSQTAQDSDLKVGKVLWVAGHSGPETADDSRTHFGIFAPGVTGLFPEGHVIELHPWEYNEVPVLLAAAFRTDVPIVALHLARPALPVPDRAALGLPSHLEAARGAYVLRPYRSDQPRMGTVVVQGTATTNGLLEVLPRLDERRLNVKIVAAVSRQLFRAQTQAYQDEVLSATDRLDATVITNRSRQLMGEWIACESGWDYALSSDWDNRWRTGGTVAEVLGEARLTPDWILEGIARFAEERPERLARLRERVDGMQMTDRR